MSVHNWLARKGAFGTRAALKAHAEDYERDRQSIQEGAEKANRDKRKAKLKDVLEKVKNSGLFTDSNIRSAVNSIMGSKKYHEDFAPQYEKLVDEFVKLVMESNGFHGGSFSSSAAALVDKIQDVVKLIDMMGDDSNI